MVLQYKKGGIKMLETTIKIRTGELINKEELRKMNIKEIAKYVNELENEMDGNSFDYQNWCYNKLDEILEEKGYSMDYFQKELIITKAISNLKEYGIKEKEAKEEVDCLVDEEVKKIASNMKTAKDYAHDIAMVGSMEDDEYYKKLYKEW
jgi:hypothetical protein